MINPDDSITDSIAVEVQSEPHTDNRAYDYKVEVCEMHDPEGRPTGLFGTRRLDNNRFFSTCSNQYQVLQNSELLDAAEQAWGERGLGKWTRSITLEDGGARVYASYDFRDTGMTEVKKGDIVGMRLTVTNSFDCTMRASIDVGLLRLVCTNGMTSTFNGLAMSQKHTTALNPKFIAASMDDVFTGYQQTVTELRTMSEIGISQVQGTNILSRLAVAEVFSRRTADKINAIWEKPTYSADADRTLYNLYNAATQHLTHEVGGVKPELAYETSKDLYRKLRKATAQRDYLEQLSTPVLINN